MTTRPSTPHLSPDDIDLWLDGQLPAERTLHLDACPACHERAFGEAAVVERLARLAQFAPSGDFADRVLAQVRIGQPLAAPGMAPGMAPAAVAHAANRRAAARRRRSWALAATVAVVLVGSMAGSVAWSLANQAAISSAGAWLGAESTRWLWTALQGAATTLFEQPWYDTVRSWMTTPGRAALAGGGALLAYAMGLLTLRRLMSAPAPRVADAAV